MSLIGMVNFWNGKRRRENEMETAQVQDILISKKEAARILACSLRSIDRLVQRGKLNKVMTGARVKFRLEEVERLRNKGWK